MLALAGQRARGFALLGSPSTSLPDSSWETIALGYDMAYQNYIAPGSPNWLGDIGNPRNIGEGYRRNEKYIYYAYDANFGGYFGYQGETNADLAFAIMNNVFTNYPSGVDGYSPNLTEFPFDSQHYNGVAQGLYLTDLKSVILHLLVEQMGLAEPERYTWTLHDRVIYASPPGCPLAVRYTVVQRNYNSVDLPLTGPETGTAYSPYVNNLYYTYGVADDCDHHPPAWSAVTIPFSTDTTVPEYTAVAANNFEGGAESGLGGLEVGGYYTGLTVDDVAGLRYLMSSNNIVRDEEPATGALLEFTNLTQQMPLTTANLYALLQYAQTNAPAAVIAFAAAQNPTFPPLVIDAVSNYYTLVTNWNVTSYFYIPPGEPAGSLPSLAIVTNYPPILSWQTNYVYTFGNLVTVDYYSNTPVQLLTITPQIAPGSPYNAPLIQTNVSVQTIILTNTPSGDYYLLPPDSCGFDIVSTQYANYYDIAGNVTNIITMATNNVSTNATGFVGTQEIVQNFTNNWLIYYGCTFTTSSPAAYQGTEGVQFVRVSDANLDPLTQVFIQPITNTYTMNSVNLTTGQIVPQTFQRIVTAPDILLSAFDDAQANTFNGTVTRSINFETGQVYPGLSGPGIIDGQSVFDFNKVGTAWWNGPFADTNAFIIGQQSSVNQTTGIPSLLWASFDGSTNEPIVYPTMLSISELESQMIISISPTSLPDGTNGLAYTPTTFTATGGTPPYTWSIPSGSPLPYGLQLFNGTLIGTPNGNTNGVYDTAIQLTDSSNPAKTVLTPYTITIH